jgi:hypothetical protein
MLLCMGHIYRRTHSVMVLVLLPLVGGFVFSYLDTYLANTDNFAFRVCLNLVGAAALNVKMNILAQKNKKASVRSLDDASSDDEDNNSGDSNAKEEKEGITAAGEEKKGAISSARRSNKRDVNVDDAGSGSSASSGSSSETSDAEDRDDVVLRQDMLRRADEKKARSNIPKVSLKHAKASRSEKTYLDFAPTGTATEAVTDSSQQQQKESSSALGQRKEVQQPQKSMTNRGMNVLRRVSAVAGIVVHQTLTQTMVAATQQLRRGSTIVQQKLPAAMMIMRTGIASDKSIQRKGGSSRKSDKRSASVKDEFGSDGEESSSDSDHSAVLVGEIVNMNHVSATAAAAAAPPSHVTPAQADGPQEQQQSQRQPLQSEGLGMPIVSEALRLGPQRVGQLAGNNHATPAARRVTNTDSCNNDSMKAAMQVTGTTAGVTAAYRRKRHHKDRSLWHRFEVRNVHAQCVYRAVSAKLLVILYVVCMMPAWWGLSIFNASINLRS